MTDLKGKRFGRFIVISQNGKIGKKKLWICQCDCGEKVTRRKDDLVRGRSRSCGCLRRDTNSTHRKSKTREYRIWSSMIQRCKNPNTKSHKNYGNRGIKVCDRWMKFENFLEDMGIAPAETTLDRIDNDKGYYLDNCRWATRKEQMRNKRTNHLVTVFGVTKTAIEWSEITGIHFQTFLSRLRKGLTPEEAIKKTQIHENQT